jgi:hypothetical protein
VQQAKANRSVCIHHPSILGTPLFQVFVHRLTGPVGFNGAVSGWRTSDDVRLWQFAYITQELTAISIGLNIHLHIYGNRSSVVGEDIKIPLR